MTTTGIDIQTIIGTKTRNTLIKKDNNGNYINTNISDLIGKPFAIYCSASWCPPCVRFTPQLIEFYNKLKTDNKDFEIVFCSLDESQKTYDDYFKKMPWRGISFGDEITAAKYGVYTIPALLFYDDKGNLITKDGVNLVRNNSLTPTNYPWSDFQQKSSYCSIQ